MRGAAASFLSGSLRLWYFRDPESGEVARRDKRDCTKDRIIDFLGAAPPPGAVCDGVRGGQQGTATLATAAKARSFEDSNRPPAPPGMPVAVYYRYVPAGADGPQYDAPRTTYQQDLWHYTLARMVDACTATGALPFYGPFGDIKDTVACEDQFRNAYLLGCVGAWSLHPVQIDIAKRVFSPDPADVAHALRVIEAMGDGTGAIMLDGKMEDDASCKQCNVIVALARELAARDPQLAATYGF